MANEYLDFGTFKSNGRGRIQKLYNTQIVREAHFTASFGKFTNTSDNGLHWTNWFWRRIAAWNGGQLISSPMMRLENQRYGAATSDDNTANSSELGSCVWVDSGGGLNHMSSLESGRLYSDNSSRFHTRDESRNLYSDEWVVHQWCLDGSMMTKGHEVAITGAGAGSIIGDGSATYADVSLGLYYNFVVATYTSATQGISNLNWEVRAQDDPKGSLRATSTLVDSGTVQQGVGGIQLDRDVLGSAISAVIVQVGPFDFRSTGYHPRMYMQGSQASGNDPFEVLSGFWTTANPPATGREPFIFPNGGSNPQEWITGYDEAESMWDAFDPDIAFHQGSHNYVTSDNDDAATHYGQWIDVVRGWKNVPMVFQCGPPVGDGAQSSAQEDEYDLLPDTLWDGLSDTKSDIVVSNERLRLENTYNATTGDDDTLPGDEVHPSYDGGEKLTYAFGASWEDIVAVFGLTETIPDSTILSQDAEDFVTVSVNATEPGTYTGTLTIKSDADTDPYEIFLTVTIGAGGRITRFTSRTRKIRK